MSKLIKFSEEKDKGNIVNLINLIPVHINKMRCQNYFWHWSSNHGDWIRTEKISVQLKRGYKNPNAKK
jgi:hypothetical protein